MPLNIDFTQVLLHMLNFVILAGALGFLLFKPITKFMADRQKHFEDIAKENEEAAKTNADMKAEYEQKLIKEIENGKFFSLKTLRKVIELDSLIKTYK